MKASQITAGCVWVSEMMKNSQVIIDVTRDGNDVVILLSSQHRKRIAKDHEVDNVFTMDEFKQRLVKAVSDIAVDISTEFNNGMDFDGLLSSLRAVFQCGVDLGSIMMEKSFLEASKEQSDELESILS